LAEAETVWRLFLDSQAIRQSQLNFDSRAIRSLLQLIDAGVVELYITDVVYRELLSWLHDEAHRTASAYSKFLKESAPLRTLLAHTGQLPLLKLDALTLENQFIDLLDCALVRMRVQVLLTRYVSVETILSDYFRKLPPFNRTDRKSEFPDAISIGTLRAFSSASACVLHLVSADKNFEDSVPDATDFRHYTHLTEFLDVINSSEHVRSSFLKRSLLERFEDICTLAKREFEKLNFILYDQEGEVLHVEATNVGLVNNHADEMRALDVLSIDGNRATIHCRLGFESRAEVQYDDMDSASYDSEEKIYIPRDEVHAFVEATDLVNATVDMTFQGLDKDSVKIERITLDPADRWVMSDRFEPPE
jgi:hypothetical protein